MNRSLGFCTLLFLLLSNAAAAQTRTIRYDGHLERDRRAVSGPAALGFSVYDGPVGGTKLWPPGNAPQSIQV